jgi:hypothetical protein
VGEVVLTGVGRAVPAGAAAALGVPAEEVALVSGAPEPLREARAAGMGTGAALWAAPDEAERAALRSARPDWLFERPADVTRTLAPWC